MCYDRCLFSFKQVFIKSGTIFWLTTLSLNILDISVSLRHQVADFWPKVCFTSPDMPLPTRVTAVFYLVQVEDVRSELSFTG